MVFFGRKLQRGKSGADVAAVASRPAEVLFHFGVVRQLLKGGRKSKKRRDGSEARRTQFRRRSFPKIQKVALPGWCEFFFAKENYVVLCY